MVQRSRLVLFHHVRVSQELSWRERARARALDKPNHGRQRPGGRFRCQSESCHAPTFFLSVRPHRTAPVQRHRDVQKGRASLSIKGQFSGTALQTTDVHAPFQRPLSLGLMLKNMVREPADARACSYRRHGSVFRSTIPTELRHGSPLHRDVPVDI